jgi:hypothetical protein
MTVAANGTDAAKSARNFEEALAFLREAARDPHHALQLDVSLSLVLALDRAGKTEQADALLSEQRGTVAWAQREAPDYVASRADALALEALALEAQALEPADQARAADAWRAFLAAQGAGFTDRARQRLSRLEGAGSKPRRRR